MQRLQALLLTTLSRVPTFPELSPLTLPPGVAHICAEGQCFCCRHHPTNLPGVCVLSLCPHYPNCSRCMIPFHVVLVPRMLPLSAHHYPWVPYPGMTKVLWCPLIRILNLPSTLPWTPTLMMTVVRHAGTTAFRFRGGGGSIEPSGRTPPSPKKGSIDRTPKILPSLTPRPWR